MRENELELLVFGEENPTEDKIHQQAIKHLKNYPQLRFYHIPNEGYRADRYAYKLKSMGVSAGVPDICIPFPKCGYAGLYLELKRRKPHSISDAQKGWIDYLNKVGYKAVVCIGYKATIDAIDDYMRGADASGRPKNDDKENHR